MSVVQLGARVDLERIPLCLRALADKIEAGDIDTETVVVVYHDTGRKELAYGVYGEDMRTSSLIGLLEYAKLTIFEGVE